MINAMLVDDEEWCLEELKGILQVTENTQVIGVFTNATEAFEAAIRDGPDIIFIDVQMPRLSGLDLAQRIKENIAHISIVLLSEKECYARNGFDIGVDDYILKPFRKDRVIKALQKVQTDTSMNKV